MKIQTYTEPSVWSESSILEPSKILNKEKVHKDGLLHKSVHLLAFNSERKIFSRKRAESELRYSGCYTTTIGTHVELEKDYCETLCSFLPVYLHNTIEWVGEFRVKDNFENEVCGLYILEIETLPQEIEKHHYLLRQSSLEEEIRNNNVTQHLEKALRLFQSKDK